MAEDNTGVATVNAAMKLEETVSQQSTEQATESKEVSSLPAINEQNNKTTHSFPTRVLSTTMVEDNTGIATANAAMKPEEIVSQSSTGQATTESKEVSLMPAIKNEETTPDHVGSTLNEKMEGVTVSPHQKEGETGTGYLKNAADTKVEADTVPAIKSEPQSDTVGDAVSPTKEGKTGTGHLKGAAVIKVEEDTVPVKSEPQADDTPVNDEKEDNGGTTRKDLMIALQASTCTGGLTCTGGYSSELPFVKSIHVKSVGNISLPLTDAQAKSLCEVAAQAPHGQGRKTVIDTSVRNTWQIEPSEVTLENRKWPAALQALTAKVATNLGLKPSDVKANLYKVLLYEKGGFFKKHRDTEKEDGMFGTLVVQLPSRYTGGNFVVSYDGATTRFDLGSSNGSSAYGCYFVAHYADCEHEMEEITSGYRLALVYSLCCTGGRYTAADVCNGQAKLQQVLRNLPLSDRIFMIPFDHAYTTASLARLGLNALKGDDRQKQKAIEAASGGTWKSIIAKVSRTDNEIGEGSDYYEFDVGGIDVGDPSFDGEAYGADGSDCTADLTWLQNVADFSSVEAGGMLLASEDEADEMWGEGNPGSVEYYEEEYYEEEYYEEVMWGEDGSDGEEYTRNREGTREMTYQIYLLVAYGAEKEFELMCADQNDPSKTSRLLDHLSQSRSTTMPYNDFVSLLPLVVPSTTHPSAEEIAKLQALFNALDLKERGVLKRKHFQLLDWFATAKDCQDVRAILETFFSQSTTSAGVLLLKADMAAYLATKPSCESLSGMMSRVVGSFQPRATKCFSKTNAIVSLVKKYSWAIVKDVALKFAQFAVEKEMQESLTNFKGTANMLINLAEISAGDTQLQSLCDVAAKMCVEDIERPAWGHLYGGYRLVHSTKSVLLQEALTYKLLFKFGNAGLIGRVETWARACKCNDTLKEFETTARKVDDGMQQHPNKKVVKRLLATLKKVVKSLLATLENNERAKKLEALQWRRNVLVAATRSPPAFSWSMPHAHHHNASIQQFLRDPLQSCTIAVGSIFDARRLSDCHVSAWYSAIITPGGSKREAHVTVKKTKEYYKGMVKEYNSKKCELQSINDQIRSLGGEVVAPAPAPGIVDLTHDNARPTKKAKAT